MICSNPWMASQVAVGKDGGASALAKLTSFKGCVLAEYVWLDADGVTRSKTMTMTARPGELAHGCSPVRGH